MIEIVIRIFTNLWPFLWEMMIGNRPFKEAIHTHRKQIITIVLIIVSVLMNALTIPKIISISSDYVILERKYKSLRDSPRGDLLDPDEAKKLIEENNALKAQVDLLVSKMPTEQQKKIADELKSLPIPAVKAPRHNRVDNPSTAQPKLGEDERVEDMRDFFNDLKKNEQ